MNAVVIGNGSSRLCIDLSKLKGQLKTYGCNALYRDFIPDVLVSMDSYMVYEIINNKAHYKTHFVTQHVNDIDKLANIGEPIHFIQHCNSTPDSGTAAVRLACLDDHTVIYMLGFDYHNNGFNNVYAGTPNYASKNHSTPTSQDNSWKSRLNELTKKYHDILFVRVTNDTDTVDKANFKHMSIEKFKEKYVC